MQLREKLESTRSELHSSLARCTEAEAKVSHMEMSISMMTAEGRELYQHVESLKGNDEAQRVALDKSRREQLTMVHDFERKIREMQLECRAKRRGASRNVVMPNVYPWSFATQSIVLKLSSLWKRGRISARERG